MNKLEAATYSPKYSL